MPATSASSVSTATPVGQSDSPLGFDRETDDAENAENAENAKAFAIEAVSSAAVVVSQTEFASGTTRYRVFDPESGEATAVFEALRYSLESGENSCSADVTNLLGLSDGSIMGTALGSPALVDPTTGEVELFVDCDESSAKLGEFIAPDTFERFAVWGDAEPTADQIEQLLTDEVRATSRFVEGDGDLWWIVADTKTIADAQVIVGGLVRFDLDERRVVELFPLDEYLGGLECADPADPVQDCERWTLVDAAYALPRRHARDRRPSP